jgi:hypothetical protein
MQFVQGRTWERMILENTRLDWPASCKICIDVLRALEYAHGRGIVHRDMKPSNVLVRAQDGSATVMDFGIAKMTTSTRLTATGQTMGTVRYMSPEQVRGQEVDLRTDIYSLGATLYESLTGETPFDGNTHFEIMTKHLSEVPRRPSASGIEVPLAVEDALMRSLAKRAQDRFDTAREMRKILEQALKDNDLGLVETQRLSRQLLGERSPASAVIPAAPAPSQQRLATANDLADELEPGNSSATAPQRPRLLRRRRRWVPIAAIGGALVAGGVTGALVMMRGGGGYRPAVKIEGATLTAGQRFGPLLVETDGAVTPAEVEGIYRTQLAALRLHVTKQKPALTVADPVTEIIAMPQAAMCLKGNWLVDPPKDCASSPSVTLFGPQGQHRMFVVSDRARLAEAIRRGIAQAACELGVDRSTPEGEKRAEELCPLTQSFVDAGVQ